MNYIDIVNLPDEIGYAIDRIRESGEVTVLTEHNQPVAVLSPLLTGDDIQAGRDCVLDPITGDVVLRSSGGQVLIGVAATELDAGSYVKVVPDPDTVPQVWAL